MLFKTYVRENWNYDPIVDVNVRKTYFDSADRAVGAEDGIGDFVEMMRIFGLRFDDQSLPFRSFRLNVILPEEASILLTARVV